MAVRLLFLVCFVIPFLNDMLAQSTDCTFKPPFAYIHFGRGHVQDVNTTSLTFYDRVASSCPTDGHYAFTSYTRDCFRGDWHWLSEDKTPGDTEGNMLLVNSSYNKGVFFATRVKGFKSATIYRLGIWMLNVCRPSDKCPFPLLPNITIRLQTPTGKIVAQFITGELPRLAVPKWTQHRVQFTAPPSETELILVLINNVPGGCGNDFALDDITFSECVKINPARVVEAKKVPPRESKKQPLLVKKEVKKTIPTQTPVNSANRTATVTKSKKELLIDDKPSLNPKPLAIVPAPLILKQRTNPLIKHIETGAGEILLNLYDNGEIDGDTVSIYHNNTLIVSEQRLSQKPISFRIQVDKNQPHHELVMVANNLGSIPPNTSLMIVTAKDNRYQVFISSTKQQNAKIVIDLKE